MSMLTDLEAAIRLNIARYPSLSANEVHTVLVVLDNALHAGATTMKNGTVAAVTALQVAKYPSGPKTLVPPPAPPVGSKPVWLNPHAPSANTASIPTVTAPLPAPSTAPVRHPLDTFPLKLAPASMATAAPSAPPATNPGIVAASPVVASGRPAGLPPPGQPKFARKPLHESQMKAPDPLAGQTAASK